MSFSPFPDSVGRQHQEQWDNRVAEGELSVGIPMSTNGASILLAIWGVSILLGKVGVLDERLGYSS